MFVSLTLTWKNIQNLILESHVADIFTRYLEVFSASKPSYFLFSRGRTNQRIESDRNKICSLDKPYSLLKFETRLEIELSVEKVA